MISKGGLENEVIGVIGNEEDGFVTVHATGLTSPGASPKQALEAIRSEAEAPRTYSVTEMARQRAEAEENGEYATGGVVSRTPFRMFADFTGGDKRGRQCCVDHGNYFGLENSCPECKTVTVNLVVDAKQAQSQVRDMIEEVVRLKPTRNGDLIQRVTGGEFDAVGGETTATNIDWNNVTLSSASLKGTVTYPDGNPKTAMGAKKPDLSVVPASALLHLATAMMNGSDKYGPYNYRDQPVSARTYVAAGLRHLLSYLDGEDWSSDTEEAGFPVHHLAHVMACCAILLDCTEVGTLNDNRPNIKGKTGEMIDRFNETKTLKLPAA